MTRYTPGIESDLLVLQWWYALGESGDLERAFSVTMTSVGTFMAEMQRTMLFYDADERGIWFAAWFDRILSGGAYGLWVRADKRQTPAALQAVLESIHWGLEHFPVLVLATLHEPVVAQAERLGFVRLGTIPGLFDGEPAAVAWIDSEHFYPAIQRFASLFTDASEARNG